MAGAMIMTAASLALAETSVVHSYNLNADGRVVSATGDEEDHLLLAGLGASLRSIFSTDKGDRAVVFANLDWAEHEEASFDQIFVQVNGPLGRWKLTGGRFFIPFGLLPSFNTEYLLLASHEREFLGLRSDAGVKLSGFFGDFDYAVSISTGAGDEWRLLDGGKGLIAGRLGWEKEDTSSGLSILYGYILDDDFDEGGFREPRLKSRFGFDISMNKGRSTVRAEVATGMNSLERRNDTIAPEEMNGSGQTFTTIQAFWDLALSSKWEWNNKYAFQREVWSEHWTGSGISYILGKYVRLRAAFEIHWNDERRNDTGQLQLYVEY